MYTCALYLASLHAYAAMSMYSDAYREGKEVQLFYFRDESLSLVFDSNRGQRPIPWFGLGGRNTAYRPAGLHQLTVE